MIRRGSLLMPINFITPSVQRKWRFSASWPGNSFWATLWLMITTRSEPSRSVSLKSRPSRSGIPRVRKNPGDMERNRARKSSWPFFAGRAVHREREADAQCPGVAPWNAEAGRHVLDSRQRADPALHVAIKIAHLLGGSPIRHHAANSPPERCAVSNGGCVFSSTKRVLISAPAPASSRNEAVICVTAKMRSRRLLPPVTRTSAAGESEAARRIRRG